MTHEHAAFVLLEAALTNPVGDGCYEAYIDSLEACEAGMSASEVVQIAERIAGLQCYGFSAESLGGAGDLTARLGWKVRIWRK